MVRVHRPKARSLVACGEGGLHAPDGRSYCESVVCRLVLHSVAGATKVVFFIFAVSIPVILPESSLLISSVSSIDLKGLG